MRKALILADETAASPQIRQRVEQLLSTDPGTSFRLVVPATPGDESNARAAARVEEGLAALAGVDAEVTGAVGDAQPIRAVSNAMEAERFDVILLSTPPPGASKWVRMDLPHRLGRKFGVAVEHLESTPAAESPASAPAASTQSESMVRVLLVEDNPNDAELTKLALEKSSVPSKCRVAANGESALTYVRDMGVSSVDLIILDLKMPVLDGFGFLEEAAKVVDLDQLMVVILSTSGRDEDRQRAHQLGAAAYLVKEDDFEAFQHAIEGLLVEVAS